MSNSNYSSASGTSRNRRSLASLPPVSEPTSAERQWSFLPFVAGPTPTGSVSASSSQPFPRHNPALIARPSSARPDLASSSHSATNYSPGTHYSRSIASRLSPFQDSSNCPLPAPSDGPDLEEYSPLTIQPSRLVLGSRYPGPIPRPASAQSQPHFVPNPFMSPSAQRHQPNTPTPELVKRLIKYIQRRIFLCSDDNCTCKRSRSSSGRAYSVWSIEREVESRSDSCRVCVPVEVVLESHDRNLNYDTRRSGGTSSNRQPIAPYDIYHGPVDFLRVQNLNEGGAHRAAEALRSNIRHRDTYLPLKSFLMLLRPPQGIITPNIVELRTGQPPALMDVKSSIWGSPQMMGNTYPQQPLHPSGPPPPSQFPPPRSSRSSSTSGSQPTFHSAQPHHATPTRPPSSSSHRPATSLARPSTPLARPSTSLGRPATPLAGPSTSSASRSGNAPPPRPASAMSRPSHGYYFPSG